MQMDLGYSFFYNESVTDLILQRLPATLLLVVLAQVLALFVGVLLGVISAQNPNGLTSHFVTFLALFGYAAPVFWTGILLLIGFSLNIHWFPVAGMREVTVSGGFWVHFVDVVRHLVLPMLTLSSIFIALYSRQSRTAMIHELESDYVRTAIAKGLSQRAVVYRHALKKLTVAGHYTRWPAILCCYIRRRFGGNSVQLARTLSLIHI